MDSDRELLALAAKAAGLDIVWNPPEHPVAGWHCATGESWDALLDDGDALRLALALKINIEHMETLKRAPHGVNCWPVGRGDCAATEHDLSDYAAATRRAIVRAAAELSRRG